MTLLGCELKRPGLTDLTAAVAIGVALWSFLWEDGLSSPTLIGAGGSLLAIVFGCVSNACGVNVTKEWKPSC